jgi:hypothetical protein
MKQFATSLALVVFIAAKVFSQQNEPYTASFIGLMGTDTVLIETYTMMNNHLYGKAFTRVPEDYIGEFSIHFYPDGSIREFNVNAMDPSNSSLPFKAKTKAFEYRLNMNCRNDTCTYYNSMIGKPSEVVFKQPSQVMDFVGGWVPLISLMEWNCIRLMKSGKSVLPLKMVNHNIGVRQIGVQKSRDDMVIFGGPFLEYTKIKVDDKGRILSTDGIGTPWNYIVTRHEPIDIVQIAKRMTRTPGIGIPSGTEAIQKTIQGTEIEISYGSPYKRGRKIFGGVVPYDSLWRTGAGGPTTITLSNAIKIKNQVIPKGAYSIYSIPKQNEWTLIFNTDLKTWPTDPDRTKDFAQINIPARKTDKIVQQFKIDIEPTTGGGMLRFSWDDVSATAEFKVVKPGD